MGDYNSNNTGSIIVGPNGKAEGNKVKYNEENKQEISIRQQFKYYAAACGAGFLGGILASIIANLITG